jgi:hypothetical protein
LENDNAVERNPLPIIGTPKKRTAISERWLLRDLNLLRFERAPNSLQLFHNRRLHVPGRVWTPGKNERTCNTLLEPVS